MQLRMAGHVFMVIVPVWLSKSRYNYLNIVMS